jgi:hypothetical protein
MESTSVLGAFALPFVLAFLVFVAVMALLGILMPLFVYQIRNEARRMVNELETLNFRLTRLLDSKTPSSTADMPHSPIATPHRQPTPDDATIEAKARYYGVGRK